ncbi:hypothetical protein ACEPAH_6437 [Sanghuangporus vaninii]
MSDSNYPPASSTKDPRPVTPVGGTASAYSGGSNFVANIETIDKYNEMDLKDSVTRPFRNFLVRLGVSEDDLNAKNVLVDSIASDPDVLQLRNDYCKGVTLETLRYGPFCSLTNHIISRLETPTTILFARNDPHLIEGLCGSKRKADVVAVSCAHPDVVDGKWKNYNPSGPRQSGGKSVSWQWKDIKIAVEFKLHQKEIKIGQSDHPSEYTSPSRDGGSSPNVEAAPEIHKSHSSSMSVSHSSSARLRAIPKRKVLEVSQTSSQKRKKFGNVRSDLLLSGGKYAVDQVSAVPNRRHVLEFLIMDGKLTVAYYDRAGPVNSEEFSFVDDLYTYVLLLKRLTEMDSWEIGFLEDLKEDVKSIAAARARLPTAGIEGTTNILSHLILVNVNYISSQKSVGAARMG